MNVDHYSPIISHASRRGRLLSRGWMLPLTLLAPTLLTLAMLTLASAAMAEEKHGMDSKMKMKGGQAMAMGCDREIHIREEAEKQMGGSMYMGAMPKKGSMAGMKMKGMKMSGTVMKKDMPAGAHDDHDMKMGGVLFMAPNEMHHVESTYSPKCGFQLYIFNAFTKPISVGRFQAFIKVSGEADGDEVEYIRFLSPNHEGSALATPLRKNLKAPFEVELNVKFPGEEDVEVFNFEVDEHGIMS